MMLEDEKLRTFTDREIARRASVGNSFVSRLRVSLSVTEQQIPTERTVTRGGTTYVQNTANIGKAKATDQAVDVTDQVTDQALESTRATSVEPKSDVGI